MGRQLKYPLITELKLGEQLAIPYKNPAEPQRVRTSVSKLHLRGGPRYSVRTDLKRKIIYVVREHRDAEEFVEVLVRRAAIIHGKEYDQLAKQVEAALFSILGNELPDQAD